MIKIQNRYLKEIEMTYKGDINTNLPKYQFDIVVNKFKIITTKKSKNPDKPYAVKINASCLDTKFQAIGIHKVSIIQAIIKRKNNESNRLYFDYNKTIEKALIKIQKHFEKEEKAISSISSEIKLFSQNFQILSFFNKIFARSIKI